MSGPAGGTPAISIILPTFNRRDTLGRAIDSIRQQSFADWELVGERLRGEPTLRGVRETKRLSPNESSPRQRRGKVSEQTLRGIYEARDPRSLGMPDYVAMVARSRTADPERYRGRNRSCSSR